MPWHEAERQRRDRMSLWSATRDLIARRRASEALRRGTTHVIDTGNPHVLAFERVAPDDRLMVFANFSRSTQAGIPPSSVLASNLMRSETLAQS